MTTFPPLALADAPVLREPPLPDLAAGPLPAFKPQAEPAAAEPGRTLTERWHDLPKFWRRLAVAVLIAGILAVGTFWPKTTAAYPVRSRAPEPEVKLVNSGDTVVLPPVAPPPAPRRLATALMTSKPIPLNTPVTAANVREYFTEVAVAEVPPGVAGAPDEFFGKFAQRDLPANQFVTAGLFGEAAVAPAPRIVPEPELITTRVHTATSVTEYIYAKTGDKYRLVETKTSPAGAGP